MINYIEKLTEKGLTTSKRFWKFMKMFLTNKRFIGNNDINTYSLKQNFLP